MKRNLNGKTKFKIAPDIDLDKEYVIGPDGRRLTEARAARLAQKILDETFGKPVGRPSLSGKSTTSPEIKARVPKKLKTALEKEAKRRGETPSALIREALERFLKTA